MKKISALIIFVLSLSMAASTVCAESLSPALEIIASEKCMNQTVSGTSAAIGSESFKSSLGLSDDDIITVVSLPEAGTLKYGSCNVCCNQEIPVSSADRLSYDGEGSAFEFRVNDSYNITCYIEKSDIINLAPTASGVSGEVFTYNNTAFFGCLEGSDPDGEAVSFEAERYPAKGILTILDSESGRFSYMPYERCSGSDSFSYRVRDTHGKYSDPCEVEIEIEKNKDCIFSDLGSCESAVWVVKAVKSGIMSADKSGELLSFEPDSKVTREEFTVSVMNLFGADNIPPLDGSVFADCEKISEENRAVVTASYLLDFVGAEKENGLVYFNPDGEITLEEASLIIGNILGIDDVQYVLADNDGLITPWARPAVMKLAEMGVTNGFAMRDCALSATLTRAQCAEMLCTLENCIKK